MVETGSTREILEAPMHPYTRRLMGTRLSIDDRRSKLRPISGEVPEATDWPGGCRFHPRCLEELDRCEEEEPELLPMGEGDAAGEALDGPQEPCREVRCWLFHQEAEG